MLEVPIIQEQLNLLIQNSVAVYEDPNDPDSYIGDLFNLNTDGISYFIRTNHQNPIDKFLSLQSNLFVNNCHYMVLKKFKVDRNGSSYYGYELLTNSQKSEYSTTLYVSQVFLNKFFKFVQ